MKRLIFLLVLCSGVLPLWSQQSNEPVYVACDIDYIYEFADTGSTVKNIMSFVKSGRLYFTNLALPAQEGYLYSGFEFILSYSYITFVKAKYAGDKKDYVNNLVAVSGFAELGKITITDVFLDEQSFEKWAETAKQQEL
jgi:hypothetical protein